MHSQYTSGRDQRGINIKERTGNGRAADAGVTILRSKEVLAKNKMRIRFGKGFSAKIKLSW
jgi:hypothetical protein